MNNEWIYKGPIDLNHLFSNLMRLGMKQTMATKYIFLLFLLARKYMSTVIKSVMMTSTPLSAQMEALWSAFPVTCVILDLDCILHVENNWQVKKCSKYLAKNALQAHFLLS